ncbi:hypothetical protein FH608_010625 [Nonomuraea phyllanthi]|uniref:Uncharacterized protein n=1 Tax=Nonomuraea phyllanthi TaxID=2219224 RepID=A0A5C4WQR0_9ACTN|nr:hypothetical protein [Nonomuraea phyllanthi]KAB8195929.1 hypothetical protein FH608_010625 [Nonomuraea phyllanthi]
MGSKHFSAGRPAFSGARVTRWERAAVTPEAVWRGVTGAARSLLHGAGRRELITVKVGRRVMSDVALVPAWDGTETPEQWLGRMQEKFGADTSAMLHARDLSLHDRDLFEVLLSGLRPAFEEHGLTRGTAGVEAFLGEYRATPGAIHRQRCGNSHFVLQGRECLRFWDGDDWIPPSAERRAGGARSEERLPSLSVSSVADRARSVVVSAGECLTWEPGVWHVAETIGPAFAFTVARRTGSSVPGERSYPFAAEPDGRVGAAWLEGYRAFLGGPASAASALARASAYGLEGPEPRREPAGDLSRVAVSSHAPRLWHASEGEALVATHGASRAFPAAVLPWLAGLAGLPIGAEHAVPGDAVELARFLVDHGALRAA